MNPYADHDRRAVDLEDELEEFENWCALGNVDPELVGAWERFDAERAEADAARH